ncbi:non-heme iron oxygenase ferredoxin subunit [Pseudoclavibacter endophyticus]|uniref:Non-heme iron oxygenase ferredoxin subunit n=1 Tax=Pseudoclavibacter endophyticus TaxID=1778590 RepID=A0A6H9WTZ1_9MICO|nr:non-heme iron oxygenase ferredoxin subunit [Pseudoclavibacter endophyticus]KAB1650145.1 non-heme iron oxygenase ferredoxin subunit [Pseudoclavibacter endophyticus]GGA56780.1 non-heme iron oxygenase ferredoxin subunit [Pseudoclavibacter endophyticus]
MTYELVCPTDEVQVDTPHRVVLQGNPIVVVRDSAGSVYAIGDTCTHGDISLSEGFVENDTIECWAHGSMFSLRSGWPLNLPAYEPVPVFKVKIEDGDIYIDPTPIYEEQHTP